MKSKKILVVHPTGNQNSKAAARGLANAGMLQAFITGININSNRWNWLPKKIITELQRRDFGEIKGRVISGAGLREGLRLLSAKLKLNFLTKHETGFACVDKVYHATDRYAAKYLTKHREEISAVYCYEDGALETFKVAKALGIKCIYELPIGYWHTHQKLNQQESELQPKWAPTWIATKDSKTKTTRKDEELALADHIIVASCFTQKTLEDYPNNLSPKSVVPYGCPKPMSAKSRKWFKGNDKLKVLYVGGLSQRKGLSYLIEAIESLKDKVKFSFIGSGNGLDLIQSTLPQSNYLETMSHSQVLSTMRSYDVLVFPSLFEGFGMVITEAMSQGMVVIASDHTALPDIADESSSILVPIRDTEAIKVALQELIDHPEKVQKLARAAIQKAQAYQWKDYENRLVEVIQTL
jgi:glycosyltransferase involved in cell wall biosynthesis